MLHLEEAHGIDLDVADAGVEKAGVAVAVALPLTEPEGFSVRVGSHP